MQNRNERECSEEKRIVEATTARVEISAGFVGPESQGGRGGLWRKDERKRTTG